MFLKIIKAILVGALVWLACIFVGGILAATTIPILAGVGAFMVSYAIAIGALAGLLYYFFGIPGIP